MSYVTMGMSPVVLMLVRVMVVLVMMGVRATVEMMVVVMNVCASMRTHLRLSLFLDHLNVYFGRAH